MASVTKFEAIVWIIDIFRPEQIETIVQTAFDNYFGNRQLLYSDSNLAFIFSFSFSIYFCLVHITISHNIDQYHTN